MLQAAVSSRGPRGCPERQRAIHGVCADRPGVRDHPRRSRRGGGHCRRQCQSPGDALKNILLYHVTHGRRNSASVLGAPGYQMLNGDRLTRATLTAAGIAANRHLGIERHRARHQRRADPVDPVQPIVGRSSSRAAPVSSFDSRSPVASPPQPVAWRVRLLVRLPQPGGRPRAELRRSLWHIPAVFICRIACQPRSPLCHPCAPVVRPGPAEETSG